MQRIGEDARAASGQLAIATTQQKNEALLAMAAALRKNSATILGENQKDIASGKARDMTPAFLDRLMLDEDRVEAIAKGIEAIAALEDPVGEVLAEWERPNGLKIKRVRVPLGVIGIIYESRPNVTADAGALCLKSGNAVILRGGSDSFHSSAAIRASLVEGLEQAGLPKTAIQSVPVTDRAAVGMMLRGLNHTIDVIVPRGGKSLIARVQDEARVPVFSHLEGICHVYIDKKAQPDIAQEVAFNAKMRRTGICGAAETLLMDKETDEAMQAAVVKKLLDGGCEVRGDSTVTGFDARVKPATEEDWHTEYLDTIISVKQVEGVKEAIEHINHYGSHHTDAIITQDDSAARRFLSEVDSAIVLHNASTQFADGGEFGMGAEIGIATGKMHARGPVGVEQLTSFKYIVEGTGQVRPV